MSTPSANGTSKPTPRIGGALTPSASTPSRNVSSPAHLTATSSKTVGRSPWKGTASASQTPMAGTLNVHTPTPSGPLPPGSSPAMMIDGLAGRTRAGTIGAKSAAGSPAGQTPAAFSNLGLTLTPLAGGLNISHQLNDTTILDNLGLVGRDTEAWTAQRVKEIVDLLGTRWGKVSQENIKRCVGRIGGLESYWEDHLGGKEKIGDRKRTLAIAGNEMVLEISWLGERVTRVVLNFMRGNEEATDELGAEILRQDLVGKSVGYIELNAFVDNLSRLARIDQLGRGRVSCFEALEGIADSMKRLWELELAKEQELTKTKASAEVRTLCERSGRPMTHTDSKIGLRLDYWVDQRVLAERNIEDRLPSKSFKNPFTLLIDCEAFDATQYPSIRTSQAWLSASVADAISDPTIPIWDDPPPTFIPGTQIPTVPDMLNLGITTGTQPDVRFVAKLDPALTFPINAAVEILNHMGQPLTQDAIRFTTYLGLLFPGVAGFQDGTKDGKVSLTRSVTSYDASGLMNESNQRFDVFTQPNSWARTITEVPFSHPRELIDILPYLRQWAFFGRLLQRSFGTHEGTQLPNQSSTMTSTSSSTKPGIVSRSSSRTSKPMNGYQHKYQNYEPASDTDSDEDEQSQTQTNPGMTDGIQNNKNKASGASDESSPDAIIETSFTYFINARRIDMAISIVLPSFEGCTYSCSINLKIHPNAVLEVEQDLDLHGGKLESSFSSDADVEKIRKKLERTLKLTEDIGATVAWLRNLINQL